MNINVQTGHNVRYCLIYASRLGIAWSTSSFQRDWSPILFRFRKLTQEWEVKAQHTGARLTIHLNDMLDGFELTDSHSLECTTDYASSNYSMTCELESTPDASGMEWAALRNYLPCMVDVIQLALGAFMSSLGVKGHAKSWEAHECNQQFRENESIDIGISQRLRKEGNVRINMVWGMKSGLGKIIAKVHISRYFESPETDLHIAENACCIDYADTCSLKWVHLLSKSQIPHHVTTYYGCEDMLELNTGFAWANLLIRRMYLWVAPIFTIQRLPATLHRTEWMDHCQLHDGSCDASSILDPVDVEE